MLNALPLHSDLFFTFSVLGLLVFLVLAYSVKTVVKGRSDFDRVNQQGGSAVLSKNLMQMAYWGLQPIGDLFIFLKISPNTISWLSLLLGALSGLALCAGHFGFAGFMATFSGLFDAVDGMVARKTGIASNSGEVLDASVDRYVEFFFFAGLIYYYREIPWLVVLALFALLGSFMVSYSTAKAEALQVTPPRGAMRRSERAFYLTLGAVLAPISIQSFESGNVYTHEGLYPIDIGYPMVFALFIVAVLSNYSAAVRMKAIAEAVRDQK